MSRLGKKPIELPEKVKISIAGQNVSAEGPAGKHQLTLHPEVSAKYLPAMRAALETQGLPVMVATRRDWSCRDGIDAEISAFLAGVAA